jgi:cyclohexadienyl dehydratase
MLAGRCRFWTSLRFAIDGMLALKTVLAVTRVLALWIASLTLAIAAPRFADPVDDVVAVFEAVDARLAVMTDVAAWKWREQRAVADPEREARVIDAAVSQASSVGLDADATRALFDLQIRWARNIQEKRFDTWRRDGFPTDQPVRSLETELRPQLDAIGPRLLRALYLSAPSFAQTVDHARVVVIRQRIAARFNAPLASEADAALLAVLQRFKPVTGQLQAIRAVGILRIGVTGDYAPFSLESRGELTGVDIALSLNLAEQLGVEPRFVHTTWPTLMRDLQQGRFDIAAGGISITPERAAVATFSPAYHRDGKTPIARCTQRARYASVSAINQPSVRVIVNPGGTNERFARERLPRANLRIYDDNKSIFQEILTGRADVMVTDATEVELQTRQHPELCRTSDELFTQADKALLLPKNADLASFTATWLRGEIERGTVRKAMQSALSSAGQR